MSGSCVLSVETGTPELCDAPHSSSSTYMLFGDSDRLPLCAHSVAEAKSKLSETPYVLPPFFMSLLLGALGRRRFSEDFCAHMRMRLRKVDGADGSEDGQCKDRTSSAGVASFAGSSCTCIHQLLTTVGSVIVHKSSCFPRMSDARFSNSEGQSTEAALLELQLKEIRINFQPPPHSNSPQVCPVLSPPLKLPTGLLSSQPHSSGDKLRVFFQGVTEGGGGFHTPVRGTMLAVVL